MKINKVNLENFKGIEKAEINFGDLTVITGKNSSGKSSVIQSLKYMTQWLKRIKTTRGLTEFSAPSLQVVHPDFITENKDYEAIRNSKSPISAGIALGVEFEGTKNTNSTLDRVFTLSAEFENISREGNKVRPKIFYLSEQKHWNEIRSEFNDEKYSVIYHNTNRPQLNERKNKYIEMYGNGQLVDRILNEENYYRELPSIFSPSFSEFKNKKAYLHLLLGQIGLSDFDDDTFMDEQFGFLESIKNIQIDTENAGEVDNEKALIINSDNERLSFDNASTLKIKRYSGEKNVFLDLFEDYILTSLEGSTDNWIEYFVEDDTLLILLELVIKIYHSEYQYRLLLSEYLQFNIQNEEKYLDALQSDEPVDSIDNLNLEFLSTKKVPNKVLKNFEEITKIVNSSIDPTTVIGTVQILLMYVDYVNNLALSKKALNLSKTIEELAHNKDLFEAGFGSRDSSEFKNPVNAMIDIQNCLGEASKLIGYKYTDMAFSKAFGSTEHCTCVAQNAYNLHDPKQELVRPLDPWEVVKPCPDGLNFNDHIYSLTAEDEINSNEPNAYTLRPKANIRGNKFNVSLSLSSLKSIMKKQNSKSFELYFKILNEDAIEDEEAYQKSRTYLNNDKEYGEVRSEILKIEELEENYNQVMDEINSELSSLTSELSYFSEHADYFFDDDSLDYDDDEDFSKFEDEVLDFERDVYDEGLIKDKIEKLTIKRNKWIQTVSQLQDDKKILLTKLRELEFLKEDFDQPWDVQLIKKILLLIDTKYVSIESIGRDIEIDSISTDLKFLNTGRNPAAADRPGEFYDNLPVGKIGGRLTELMYEEGKTKVYPYLYPSVKDHDQNEYYHSRNFDDLDWHTIKPEDEKFVTAFNMWISYLSMEVSKVESKIEGPRPQLKVTGKDGTERDVFEVGSGIGQVLPVIAICLLSKPGEIVCIEEPEAHLHPSAQAYLADFLLAMAASGRQIIVETHSPNIIDRLRLRKVHRKSWKKFQNNEWIKSELYLDDVKNIERKYLRFREPDIKVIFAEQDHNGFSSYREASIDRKGDIIFGQSIDEIWPEGFFDNAQQELSYILKARLSAEEE